MQPDQLPVKIQSFNIQTWSWIRHTVAIWFPYVPHPSIPTYTDVLFYQGYLGTKANTTLFVISVAVWGNKYLIWRVCLWWTIPSTWLQWSQVTGRSDLWNQKKVILMENPPTLINQKSPSSDGTWLGWRHIVEFRGRLHSTALTWRWPQDDYGAIVTGKKLMQSKLLIRVQWKLVLHEWIP